ncbi:MAG: tetratricopeptide repeat protein [Eubacterium sp.]|nr:tetratricopeptide repeat protein [Eubacterium sp.]
MTKNRQNNIRIKRQKLKRRVIAAALLTGMGLMLTGCGEKQTENALAYRKIGMNAMAEGNYAEAIDNFQLALDQSKGQIRNLELDICMQKAEALYLNNQPEKAIAVCDAVLAYDKSYASAYYLRGNLYLQQGDSKKALADYEQAAKYADADYEIYIQLYVNLNRAGMKEEGEKYLNEALELKGKGRYHLTNRGYIYYLMGDYEKAKEQLLQAVAIEQKEGEDDKAELYLAQTAEQLGDEQTATQYYKAYAENHADDSVVLEELGNMAMEKGDYADACAYYQKGLQTTNPSNEQLLRRGEIAALEQMYEFEQAKDKMAQYVLDYPEDEQAAREYLFLKTRTAVADQIEEEKQAAEEAAQAAEGSGEDAVSEDGADNTGQ